MVNVELGPETRRALDAELKDLERRKAESMRAFDDRMREIRALLLGSTTKATRMAALVPTYASIGFRQALRSVLAGHPEGQRPHSITEALKEGGSPLAANKLRTRVYVELAKLTENGELEKIEGEEGIRYRIRPGK
jgi:hypothetical protein